MGNNSFVYRFDDVEVREKEFTLTKAGKVLAIEPKAFRALLFLLRNPQRLISKEELLNSLWADAAVTEGSLTRCIWLLRRLLEDDIREPRYIETVATVGYRFVFPVEVSEDGKQGSEAAPVSAEIAGGAIQARPRSLRRWWLLAAAVLVVGLASLTWYLRRPLPPPHISEYAQLTHNGHTGDVLGTDGSRLYLQRNFEGPIYQVSISVGETEPLPPITLPAPELRGVSPDGSTFLVLTLEKGSSPSAPLYAVQAIGGSHRYLTDATDATWSPDGKFVAYSTPNGDLNIINSDGTGAHKLASVGGVANSISWSSDGRMIRFSKDGSIWQISSSGSNLREILPGWHAWWKCCGRWTPDARFYLFQSSGSDSPDVGQIWALDERRGMFRHPLGEPIQLTTGPINWSAPIPSKDGKKIFATGSTTAGELMRLDPKSNQFQAFLGGISADLVAFSKDGKSVAYVSFPEDILWRANRDGSDRVQLTSLSLHPLSADWSPDGTQIAFMAGSPQGLRAWIVPSRGGSPQQLLPENKGPETDPSWSPDGRKIIFATGKPGSNPGESDIRILDLASHQVTTLRDSTGMHSGHWSPDGRYIKADSVDSSTLYVFDMKTQHWSTLCKCIHAHAPWSSDSRSIYFIRYGDDPAILRIPVTGGEAKMVVSLKGFPFTGTWGIWFGLDPSNVPLMLRDVSTSDVYALTLDQ